MRTKQSLRSKQTKVCFIVARCTVKTGVLAGCICNVVRNEKGKEYQVWTYADGMTCCSCDARKPCYHIKHVLLARTPERLNYMHIAKMSAEEPTVEQSLSPFLRNAMNGNSTNGHFSGRKAS